MRFRVTRAVWALCWVLLGPALLAWSAPPAAEVAFASIADGEVRAALDRGRELETQRRWGDALSHYEEALKRRPGDQHLVQRCEAARLHYDLGRRYVDRSFLQTLARGDQRAALDTYRDVLTKIQTYYVDEPDWQRLIDRGTRALEIALGDSVFTEKHLSRATAAELNDFAAQLRAELADRVVRSPQMAAAAVERAGRLAETTLRLPATAVTYEYLCGATASLDDYSSYLTPDQLEDVYSQIEGNFVGLGIELKSVDGGLQIVKIIPGSPAAKSGLRAGDRIVGVDDQATKELNTDQAAALLQGKEGTVAELVVVNKAEPARRVRVRREHVEVPSIEDARIVDAAQGIGYFRLTSFQKTTVRDLDDALWKLHRQGMKSLIIDLRGNPGGLLTTAVEVVDKFVDDGAIVSTRGRSPQEDASYTAHRAGTWRVPLIVLIDADSASASEIFAGAIRDHKRGTLVGNRSYGKGSVQAIFPLGANHAGIRLTTAKFYSPVGLPFNKVGVEPDIRVQSVARPVDGANAPPAARDAVLEAGIEAARDQLARR